MVFYRLASFFIAASCLVSVTLASCHPPGTDAFYAYIRLDVNTKGTKALDDVALSNHFSTTFNQMASLSCDVDHRRIHVSQVETSTT